VESRTWMISVSPDGEYPFSFCGTEDEMEEAAKDLLARFRRNGFDSKLTVWTGYAWMKKEGPYCRFDEDGKHILGAAA